MIEPGVIVAKATNKSLGIVNKDLTGLFYGDGTEESDLNPQNRLMSWEVVDNETEMDTFSITLDNSDLKLFDLGFLSKGTQINLRFGYPEKLSDVFEGVITSRSGWRTMTISGQLGTEIQLTNKVASEDFTQVRLSDVARQLFLREKLIPVIDETKIVHKTMKRVNKTVWEFLRDRIKRELNDAWEVYVEGNKGYFVKKKFDGAPVVTLKYAYEETDDDYITTSEPELQDDQQNFPTETTVKGFNLMDKEFIEEKGNNDTTKQVKLGKGTYAFDEAAGVLKFKPKGVNKTAETGKVVVSSQQNPGLIEDQAQGDFNRRNAGAYRLRWPILGNPTLKAKSNALVVCDSNSISGRWYIESVRHHGEGASYNSELSMIRNAVSADSVTSNAETAAPQARENKLPVDEKANSSVSYVFNEKTGSLVPKGLK